VPQPSGLNLRVPEIPSRPFEGSEDLVSPPLSLAQLIESMRINPAAEEAVAYLSLSVRHRDRISCPAPACRRMAA
jgi:hypothetical protein